MTDSLFPAAHDESWALRVSAYLDDDQSIAERIAVREHLDSCASCASLLTDLRSVVTWIASDVASTPSPTVLSAVRERLDSADRFKPASGLRRKSWRSRAAGRWAASAIAASILVAAFSVYQTRSEPNPLVDPPRGARASTEAPPARTSEPAADRGQRPASRVARTATVAGDSYSLTLAQLERALNAERARLGPVALRELDESIAVIDRALEEAELAERADPGSAALSGYVASVRDHKLATLRAAASHVAGRS